MGLWMCTTWLCRRLHKRFCSFRFCSVQNETKKISSVAPTAPFSISLWLLVRLVKPENFTEICKSIILIKANKCKKYVIFYYVRIYYLLYTIQFDISPFINIFKRLSHTGKYAIHVKKQTNFLLYFYMYKS